MTDPVWKFEYAVECEAPQEFAWKYWTNPENWDDPPARFEFDGPFSAGTRIKTILPGQTLESVIQGVEFGREATIQLAYGEARISFEWRFKEVTAARTRVSQRIELSGTRNTVLLEQAKVFEKTAPAGMQKLKQRIESDWNRART
jgi:hypothetical protein